MEWAPGPYPLRGDPGGRRPSNLFDGEYAGSLLPEYLDTEGTRGPIQVLRLKAVDGKLPQNPFVLRKSIERCVGTKIDGAFPEGKEGISFALKVRSTNQFNKLLNLTSLIDGTAVEVIEHPTLNISRCVVNCPALTGIPDATLEEELTDQGIRGFRRITKRVGKEKVNTSTLILTIAGTIIPPHIDFGYVRCKTRPYYPAPMQCYNCWKFGHTSKRCDQSHPTCGTCSVDHAINADNPCEAEPYCKRCDKHSHTLASRKCPVYCKENEIQRVRVDRGISYPAARRLFEQANNQNSFAGVTVAGKDQQIAELSSKVDQFQQEMERKNKRIEFLESNLNTDTPSGTNAMVAELLQKVELLTSEMRKKDERIQALETAQQNDSRMEMVRKHGTIEDLVSKVAFLENKLRLKEREVDTFTSLFQKSQNQAGQTNKANPSNVSRKLTFEPTPHSQTQSQSNTASTNTSKNRKQKEKQFQLTPMYESDTSPTSVHQTSNERTPKRDHSLSDSDDSSGQPKNKIANDFAPSGDGGMSE